MISPKVIGTCFVGEEDVFQPLDHVTLPSWLSKLFPYLSPSCSFEENNQPHNEETCINDIFIHDEVLFIARQDMTIRDILDKLESDDMYSQLYMIYQASKLSELSRPIDLRDINFKVHDYSDVTLHRYFPLKEDDIIQGFVMNIIKDLWKDLPMEVKKEMVLLTDEFISSLILSKAIPKSSFASGTEFCHGMQFVLKLGVLISFAYKLQENDVLSHILNTLEDVDIHTHITRLLAIESLILKKQNELTSKENHLSNEERYVIYNREVAKYLAIDSLKGMNDFTKEDSISEMTPVDEIIHTRNQRLDYNDMRVVIAELLPKDSLIEDRDVKVDTMTTMMVNVLQKTFDDVFEYQLNYCFALLIQEEKVRLDTQTRQSSNQSMVSLQRYVYNTRLHFGQQYLYIYEQQKRQQRRKLNRKLTYMLSNN